MSKDDFVEGLKYSPEENSDNQGKKEETPKVLFEVDGKEYRFSWDEITAIVKNNIREKNKTQNGAYKKTARILL